MKRYYNSLTPEDVCSCKFCRNYRQHISRPMLALAETLKKYGIDIEKPFELIPMEPERGIIEYAAQYIVMGEEEPIEIGPICLGWGK